MSSDVFENLAIFEGLSSSQIALLRALFVPCDFYADEFIFEQGDPAEHLYVVVVGEVVVKFKPKSKINPTDYALSWREMALSFLDNSAFSQTSHLC